MSIKKISVLLLWVIIIVSCAKVPITGRKQLNVYPESDMVAMSLKEYNDFLKKNPPVNAADPNAQLVKNVGGKISNAVIKYLAQNKMSDRVAGYKWEFNLVNNKEANAWCMPGGKVVVYSGLLPITKDETSLAFVMGHEIGHAIAHHGNERMSQLMVAQLGGAALSIAISEKSQQTKDIFNTAYGIGVEYGGILPYSRLHESEADKLGMVFMAMAGYDPRQAADLWKRMAAAGGPKPPEILSTHPSDEHRMAEMKKFLPEAMKYYKVK